MEQDNKIKNEGYRSSAPGTAEMINDDPSELKDRNLSEP